MTRRDRCLGQRRTRGSLNPPCHCYWRSPVQPSPGFTLLVTPTGCDNSVRNKLCTGRYEPPSIDYQGIPLHAPRANINLSFRRSVIPFHPTDFPETFLILTVITGRWATKHSLSGDTLALFAYQYFNVRLSGALVKRGRSHYVDLTGCLVSSLNQSLLQQ